MGIAKTNTDELLANGKERLSACKAQRIKTGFPNPTELYWGGYVDALCQAADIPTISELNWAEDGVKRMFSKPEVHKRLVNLIAKCEGCILHKTRVKTVPGTGPLWTPLAFIGEGPGAAEDIQGIPFCGKSGELLFGSNGLLEKVIGYTRENVLIRNTVCCRPPGNRTPSPEETLSCAGYLRASLLNVYPKVIVALGASAAAWFFGQHVQITAVRGKPITWEGITVLPTYHPAYILRNPAASTELCDDLKTAAQLLQQG